VAKFDTFRPFRLHLKDGRTYDLLQPGLLLVLHTFVVVGIPAPGETRPLAAEVVEVPVELIDSITRIEPIAPPPASTPTSG
jgi:hypothetical protein